ncbi:DMT family transporter [Ahrensia sp. R2A130]|uniref:DMT family transporter n=1 Tax=Ahrensia sp. R2A130 TaxID=744979 RepID=UPI0001E09C16|nr:DMT family transporter [Ahrensia sp. R2A130]EFL90613.1 transporter of the DMT superfamily [Ahrensia sp. R2A130]
MTVTIFLVVMCAAAIHASWNALVKSTADKVVSMTAVTIGHAPLGLLVLPFVPMPPAEAWPYLAGSVVVHTGYQLSLMRAYRLGDFTQVYPIARGSGPALVALFSVAVLSADLATSELAGIALIVFGIFTLGLVKGRDGLRNPTAVGAALITGVFIASYSLLDGLGARVSGHAIGYIAWMTVINAFVFAALMAFLNLDALKATFTVGLKPLILGGTGSVTAYALVVWAMTQAPIAVVTALRETSTVFALFIGVIFLGEKLTGGKILATCLVLAGVITLRLL